MNREKQREKEEHNINNTQKYFSNFQREFISFFLTTKKRDKEERNAAEQNTSLQG